MNVRLAAIAAVLGSLAAPATATGDGLPVGGVDTTEEGVVARSGAARYVALPARGGTVVARLERPGARAIRTWWLRGSFTVPGVALDGTTSGLSADGRTLVLIRPRTSFPQRRTRLAVFDTTPLALRHAISLNGDYSFDALSPDGRLLYLIEYVSRRDPTRYVVRAYDLEQHRLLRGAIIDPREPDERMAGLPLTRAQSPDGRWEYTLYDGTEGHPFVHALDTAGRRAFCVDLHGLEESPALGALRLAVEPAGRWFSVTDRGRSVAVVDARTFAVTAPARLEWGQPLGTTGFDVVGSWGWLRAEVPAGLVKQPENQ